MLKSLGRKVAIDEVIMGNVLQAGQGKNPGRQAMIRARLCKETPACSINKVCGSGLKAIAVAAQSIMTDLLMMLPAVRVLNNLVRGNA